MTVAHLFAFRVSSRLVSDGRIHPHDAKIAGAQLAGAAYVALVGYEVASSNGSPRGRALVSAGSVLVVALGIAVFKNVLGGH